MSTPALGPHLTTVHLTQAMVVGIHVLRRVHPPLAVGLKLHAHGRTRAVHVRRIHTLPVTVKDACRRTSASVHVVGGLLLFCGCGG